MKPVPFLLLLLLAGCATVPQKPASISDWNEVKRQRQALAQWEIGGRAAVATGDDGWNAGMSWKQDGGTSELKLQGALGIGGVRVRTDGESLEITTSKGESLSGQEARAMLENQLGLILPLRAMRFWLLGVPEPGEPALVQLDDAGRLGQLNQSDWTIHYDQYQDRKGAWLPGRVRLEQGNVKVRVVIDRWEL